MTFDDLLSILRAWTGRTVTIFMPPGSDQPNLDDPITGTLYEGHAPAVAARTDRQHKYRPTEDSVQFTIWREEVPNSRWPVGITCHLARGHASANWDTGREGRAIWISLSANHPSLWIPEDE